MHWYLAKGCAHVGSPGEGERICDRPCSGVAAAVNDVRVLSPAIDVVRNVNRMRLSRLYLHRGITTCLNPKLDPSFQAAGVAAVQTAIGMPNMRCGICPSSPVLSALRRPKTFI